ncbi:hypothetical protein GCM10023347_08030 [Streptomyces chumphonensis]
MSDTAGGEQGSDCAVCTRTKQHERERDAAEAAVAAPVPGPKRRLWPGARRPGYAGRGKERLEPGRAGMLEERGRQAVLSAPGRAVRAQQASAAGGCRAAQHPTFPATGSPSSSFRNCRLGAETLAHDASGPSEVRLWRQAGAGCGSSSTSAIFRASAAT